VVILESKTDRRNLEKKDFIHPYIKFILKKAIFYVIVIIISLTFAWAIPRFMPGSPVDTLLRPPPQGLSPEELENYLKLQQFIIEEFGLNKTVWQQYVDFWKGVLRLDFGVSYVHQPTTVLEFMLPYLVFTLSLVVPVLICSFFLGNWIGAKTAYMEGKGSKIVYNILIFLQSAPFYWLGLIIYVILIVRMNIFPSYGAVSPEYIPGLPGNFFRDLLEYAYHWTAPFITLMIIQTGSWATGMRSMTLYEKDSEYLLYTEQLGFKQALIRRYAKRNAILPQITGLNMTLNNLIGQTIIIEAIFGWPGLGVMNIAALNSRDYPLIIGGFIITLLIVVVGNFILDITYGFIDPRIRTGART
jgi:peptide/nickel transport system permease protein